MAQYWPKHNNWYDELTNGPTDGASQDAAECPEPVSLTVAWHVGYWLGWVLILSAWFGFFAIHCLIVKWIFG